MWPHGEQVILLIVAHFVGQMLFAVFFQDAAASITEMLEGIVPGSVQDVYTCPSCLNNPTRDMLTCVEASVCVTAE